MEAHEAVTLSRDCEAILVPSGDRVTLPRGSQVRVTQALGGSYTVTTDRGSMVRIAGKDADALGLEPAVVSRPRVETSEDVEKLVWDQLRTCFDPEIPVNIVDLGLVYDCRVNPLAAGGNGVEVKFTLTARGCGMGEFLKEDIRGKLLSVPGVTEVEVQLVWDPPWDQSMISAGAKYKLGMV